eukprot:Rhum_TRINITY_DN3590_c0_g1::Rhum_TRINITY_DN3590_c0_g1_i1::g.11342::m.11342
MQSDTSGKESDRRKYATKVSSQHPLLAQVFSRQEIGLANRFGHTNLRGGSCDGRGGFNRTPVSGRDEDGVHSLVRGADSVAVAGAGHADDGVERPRRRQHLRRQRPLQLAHVEPVQLQEVLGHADGRRVQLHTQLRRRAEHAGVQDAVPVHHDHLRHQLRDTAPRCLDDGDKVGNLAEGKVARDVRLLQLHHRRLLVHHGERGEGEDDEGDRRVDVVVLGERDVDAAHVPQTRETLSRRTPRAVGVVGDRAPLLHLSLHGVPRLLLRLQRIRCEGRGHGHPPPPLPCCGGGCAPQEQRRCRRGESGD